MNRNICVIVVISNRKVGEPGSRGENRYTHMCVYIYIYIYVYIYIYRERERYMYMYIYIYKHLVGRGNVPIVFVIGSSEHRFQSLSIVSTRQIRN